MEEVVSSEVTEDKADAEDGDKQKVVDNSIEILENESKDKIESEDMEIEEMTGGVDKDGKLRFSNSRYLKL